MLNRLERCARLLEEVVESNEAADSTLGYEDKSNSSKFEASVSVKRKARFLLEQARLTMKSPKQRRFSPMMLATAMLWDNTSPNLYNQLVKADLFCLPNSKYV